MPPKSKAQQKLMGADLQRAREGKKTHTGMSEDELEDYASGETAKLPERKKPAKKKGKSHA